MFKVDERKRISMIQNDFGEILPITIHNVLTTDIIKFIIYNEKGIVLTKEFNVDENNIMNFKLSKEDSEKLSVGYYNYAIKQYRNEELIDTLEINDKGFVVKKGIEEE